MKRDQKKLPDHVLGVVSRLEVAAEGGGWVARITDGQLDRKDYVALNEALEALGGKWNRKAKGHLFGRSPKEAIDDLLLTGQFTRSTAGDFFQTPPGLAKRMVEWAVRAGDRVLEPSAGLGRIAAAVLGYGDAGELTLVEKDATRATKLVEVFGTTARVIAGDFTLFVWPRLSSVAPPGSRLELFDAVVMNPPFSQAQECAHILHALRFLRPGGRLASVASAGVRFRETAPYKELRARLKELDAQVEDLSDDTFAGEGTRVRTVLIRATAR